MFFQDEATFGRINKLVKCWAPKKVRPHIAQQKVRQYLYAYSVTSPHDGSNFSLILPDTNSKMMSLFLEYVSEYYAQYRCIIIMDNAPWHSKKLLTKHTNLRFVELPPYSPELNGTEHLWDHIREKYFHNRHFESLEAVENTLIEALEAARADQKTIQSLVGFD